MYGFICAYIYIYQWKSRSKKYNIWNTIHWCAWTGAWTLQKISVNFKSGHQKLNWSIENKNTLCVYIDVRENSDLWNETSSGLTCNWSSRRRRDNLGQKTWRNSGPQFSKFDEKYQLRSKLSEPQIEQAKN